MIGTAIVLQFVELVGWSGLYLKLKGDAQRQILIHGKLQPQHIPIVDEKLKQLAGHPTKIQKMRSNTVIGLLRRAVNTQAFEHIVSGMSNENSKMRGFTKKSPMVRVL